MKDSKTLNTIVVPNALFNLFYFASFIGAAVSSYITGQIPGDVIQVAYEMYLIHTGQLS